jgi:hypothetical protein
MADFCRQCHDETFGPLAEPEMYDSYGLTTEEEWAEGKAKPFLCEGCEFILVDPQGYCIGGCGHPDEHASPRETPA